MAGFITGFEAHRLVFPARNPKEEWPAKKRLLAIERLPDATVQLGVAGFPNGIAGVDSLQVQVIPPELEPGHPFPFANPIDPATLFRPFRVTETKNQAIPNPQMAAQFRPDFRAADGAHLAQKHPA